jgi:hypothetical protein
MKKTIYFLIFIISLILGTGSCKVDNYPYPDAQFYGAIRDSTGGGLVETDLNSGTNLGMYEQGYETPTIQNWVVKQNGEFRNNLVYSGTYDCLFQSCNFFPYTEKAIAINPGENKHDFLVVPYIRIKNASITYDATAKKIKASFSIEGGKPTVKVAKVSLYAFTDIYVGEYVKKSLTATATDVPTITLSGAAQTINTATVYNLSIDLTQSANALVFKIKRNYYFRVGAMGIQSGVGTIRTNYAPYVVIPLAL